MCFRVCTRRQPSFHALGVSSQLLGRAGSKHKVLKPTDTQVACLQALQAAGQPPPDVQLLAPTGSGKTHAFLLPLLSRLLEEERAQRDARQLALLVVVPTRELAHQVAAVATQLATPSPKFLKRHPSHKALVVRKLVGKLTPTRRQSLKDDTPHVVVGTPAALADAIPRDLSLSDVAAVVCDEADALAASHQRTPVMSVLRHAASLKMRPQMWWVGATTSAELRRLQDALPGPNRRMVKVDLSSGGRRAVPTVIQHSTLRVDGVGVKDALRRLLHASDRRPARTMVFATSAAHAEALAAWLPSIGVSAACLLPSYFNTARRAAVSALATGRVKVLVCVDGASRGLDFPGVDLVVSTAPPPTATDYVHRVGRAGRASAPPGAAAPQAVTMVKTGAEAAAMARFAKEAGVQMHAHGVVDGGGVPDE